MKPEKKHYKHSGNGFTLIEVILIVVIMAIAGALLASIMGRSLTGSPLPVQLVNSQYRIIQEMEAINSEYRQQLNQGANGTLDLDTFEAWVTARVLPAGIQANIQRIQIDTGLYGGTQQPVLSVTLQDGQGQAVQSFFTR